MAAAAADFICDCGCRVTPGDIPCEPDHGRCPLEAHYVATLHPFKAVAAIFDAAAARAIARAKPPA